MISSLDLVKTLDSGSSWLYVLSWPPGEEGVKREAFVIPVFVRENGILMALPMDFLPPEILTRGLKASASDMVGPSTIVKRPGVQEAENGEEIPIGLEINCLLVDFSADVLTSLTGNSTL